ncbi:MAG: hypothetical protein O2894_12265 [Planctomycetota bacterium]|nr:hypothetical protein [Planctomycetota bacterium]
MESTQASEVARERTRVMFLTLAGEWSVREGYEHLGVRRTRFQDLRRQMLEAAVHALESGLSGRPRRRVDGDSLRLGRLRLALQASKRKLERVRAQLLIAESGAGSAARERCVAQAAGRGF